MVQMNSYQKLKARVDELESDKKFYQKAIRSLVLNPNSLSSEIIKQHVKDLEKLENLMLLGSPNPPENNSLIQVK